MNFDLFTFWGWEGQYGFRLLSFDRLDVRSYQALLGFSYDPDEGLSIDIFWKEIKIQ